MAHHSWSAAPAQSDEQYARCGYCYLILTRQEYMERDRNAVCHGSKEKREIAELQESMDAKRRVPSTPDEIWAAVHAVAGGTRRPV